MTMIKVFHGTTDRALDSILEVGEISPNEGKRWTASQDEVYFWNPLTLQELEGFEELEEAEEYAFRRAVENALCAFAHDREAKRIAVISFWVDKDEVEEDNSCPNMAGTGCFRKSISVKSFEEVKATSSDLSFWKFFAASTLSSNDYFDFSAYSYEENKMIQELGKSENSYSCNELLFDHVMDDLTIVEF